MAQIKNIGIRTIPLNNRNDIIDCNSKIIHTTQMTREFTYGGIKCAFDMTKNDHISIWEESRQSFEISNVTMHVPPDSKLFGTKKSNFNIMFPHKYTFKYEYSESNSEHKHKTMIIEWYSNEVAVKSHKIHINNKHTCELLEYICNNVVKQTKKLLSQLFAHYTKIKLRLTYNNTACTYKTLKRFDIQPYLNKEPLKCYTSFVVFMADMEKFDIEITNIDVSGSIGILIPKKNPMYHKNSTFFSEKCSVSTVSADRHILNSLLVELNMHDFLTKQFDSAFNCPYKILDILYVRLEQHAVGIVNKIFIDS